MGRNSPPRELMRLSNKGSAGRLIPGHKVHASAFDLSKVEAPTKIYSADSCNVIYRDGEIYLIFSQHALFGDEIETALSLKMHGYYAKQFLKSINGMQSPGLYGIVDILKIKSKPLGDLNKNPKNVAKFSANIMQFAIAGYDSAIDFYLLSPIAAFRSGVKSSEVPLIAIARVELSTSLALGMIEKMKEFESDFPDDSNGSVVYERDGD